MSDVTRPRIDRGLSTILRPNSDGSWAVILDDGRSVAYLGDVVRVVEGPQDSRRRAGTRWLAYRTDGTSTLRLVVPPGHSDGHRSRALAVAALTRIPA